MIKLKIFKSVLSILIIGLIFLKVPKESLGLGGFQKSNNFLNSQFFFNFLTGISVLIYFGIALKLNLDLDLYYSNLGENEFWLDSIH